MLIERLVLCEQKNVLLLVPRGAWENVWKPALRNRLSHLGRGAFSGLEVLMHTDLLRGGEVAERFEFASQRAHAVVIDEAHHFRNIGTRGIVSEDVPDAAIPAGLIRGTGKVKPSRYRQLFDIIGDKRVYMLTATPINNELSDLRHMIELFSRRQEDYFASKLGIHKLRAHFNALNKRLDGLAAQCGQGSTEVETDTEQARELLSHDTLFNALVVQRSRAYVKESQLLHGGRQTIFPEREPPRVADYELRSTYGKLLETVAAAFDKTKPLFSLAPYSPLGHVHEQPENKEVKFEINRQFNAAYERKSKVEEIKLEYDRLLKENHDLDQRLNAFPNRVFSSKQPPTPGTRAVLFCFVLPAAGHSAVPDAEGQLPWTEKAGRAAWYLYDLAADSILDEPAKIVDAIRCVPDTPRHCVIEKPTLAKIRGKIEQHIKNGYLKSVQAPISVTPALKAWMELN